MIQMNDSLMVSTVTDDVTTQMETPTATENNQLTLLSEADEHEDENQDETSQSSEHNMDSTANASPDENNHNDEHQNNREPVTASGVNTSLDEEMDAKYGSRTTRWNLRQ